MRKNTNMRSRGERDGWTEIQLKMENMLSCCDGKKKKSEPTK